MTACGVIPSKSRLNYPEALLWISLGNYREVCQFISSTLGSANMSADVFRRQLENLLPQLDGVREYDPAGALMIALKDGAVISSGRRQDKLGNIPSSEWAELRIVGLTQQNGAHAEAFVATAWCVRWKGLSFDTAGMLTTFPPVSVSEQEDRMEISVRAVGPANKAARPSAIDQSRVAVNQRALDPATLREAFRIIGTGNDGKDRSKGRLAVAVAALICGRFGGTTTAASVEASWRGPAIPLNELLKIAGLSPE